MEVGEKTTKYMSQYRGQTYYFCSRGCLLDFEDRPADFGEESNRKVGLARLAMASSQAPLVYEVMTPKVLTIPENISLTEAAKKMRSTSKGGLIVIDRKGEAIGIITETDIVRRVIAKGLSPARVTVRYAMSSPLITIGEDANILQAAREMTRRCVKRLAVLNKGRLVGIITMSDLNRVTPAVVRLLSQLPDLP